MQMRVQQMDWEYATPMRLSYRTKTHARTVVVELREGETAGRGEGLGVAYHGETVETLLQQLAAVRDEVSEGVSREALYGLLPAGGARNAIDCALWDLEAKRAACRVWDLIGIQHSLRPLESTYTLGVDSPEAMGRLAARLRLYSRLKLKMDGGDDLERVAAVRRARPDAMLVVDANQAWTERQLRELVPRFFDLEVRLIEQPLPVGKDDMLAEFSSAIPLCADESCQTSECVPALVGKYEYVNVKLDKTGGLTEAIRLVQRARAAGLKLMVGCMGGSSLSMAPAFIIGQWCEVADLDGPLLTKADIPDGIHYEGSRMSAPTARLWG
jgi:L-Ala-D/L-Glu epimerase